MNDFEKLKKLYANESKHSNYQVLSERLNLLIGNDQIKVKTRYEKQRLKYILNNIDVKGKTVLDIGGNTGYFSFEMIANGASMVHYYEGNKEHAEFVRLSAKVLGVTENIVIKNEYLEFDEDLDKNKYDIVLLLNVLHHVGDDYGKKELTVVQAKKIITDQLNKLSPLSGTVVFQLGYNWKGNRDIGLFDKGTKKEVIDFVGLGIKHKWEIIKIGIPEKRGSIVEYYDLDENNINRDDSLGEFLNRPLFILRSLNSK